MPEPKTYRFSALPVLFLGSTCKRQVTKVGFLFPRMNMQIVRKAITSLKVIALDESFETSSHFCTGIH